MNLLPIKNPFNAPVWHIDSCESTMTLLKSLADNGAEMGTTLISDAQTEGRGRVTGRKWESGKGGENLALSFLYKGEGLLPSALPIRVGLAILRASEGVFPAFKGLFALKWPNDLLIDLSSSQPSVISTGPYGKWRKVAGIICEGSAQKMIIGLGLNIAEKAFPPTLDYRASSLLFAEKSIAPGEAKKRKENPAFLRNCLAETFLLELSQTLNPSFKWQELAEALLWGKEMYVKLEEGQAESGNISVGQVLGLSKDGSLLVDMEGQKKSFANAELLSFSYNLGDLS